jgi:hypothetical protein
MVPKESYAKRALATAKEDLHGTKMDQAGMMMAIKAVFEKKGHTLNVYETRGRESQKNIIHEQYKKEHKKAHLEYCQQREGIKAGNPRARNQYEETKDLFAVLDDYDEDTKFLYGYDLILEDAEQMTSLLRTVVSANAAHLQGDILGTAFGTTWGQDANKHIFCLAFSVFFDNESKDTWGHHLGTVVKKVPSIDIPKKVMIAGECSF